MCCWYEKKEQKSSERASNPYFGRKIWEIKEMHTKCSAEENETDNSDHKWSNFKFIDCFVCPNYWLTRTIYIECTTAFSQFSIWFWHRYSHHIDFENIMLYDGAKTKTKLNAPRSGITGETNNRKAHFKVFEFGFCALCVRARLFCICYRVVSFQLCVCCKIYAPQSSCIHNTKNGPFCRIAKIYEHFYETLSSCVLYR